MPVAKAGENSSAEKFRDLIYIPNNLNHVLLVIWIHCNYKLPACDTHKLQKSLLVSIFCDIKAGKNNSACAKTTNQIKQ